MSLGDGPARRLAALALAAALGCAGTADTPSTGEQFDAVWSDFDRTYPYFLVKGVDWDAARAAHRPRAAEAATQSQLAGVLVELLGELRDQHVNLIDPAGRWIPTFVPSREPNFDRATWASYLARFDVRARGRWGYGWVGAVPYVYVEDWSQPLADLDAALEAWKDAPGLVIDLRMNPGGNSSYAEPLLRRLLDQPRTCAWIRERNGPGHGDFGAPSAWTLSPGGAWQFTRPVLVLTGPVTASSSEMFVSAARELPHVTLAGATTSGSTGNPARRPLEAGWSYTISRWLFTTPDGLVVEGNGIAPHAAVPVTAAELLAGVDPVLDFAEAWAADPAVLR